MQKYTTYLFNYFDEWMNVYACVYIIYICMQQYTSTIYLTEENHTEYMLFINSVTWMVQIDYVL